MTREEINSIISKVYPKIQTHYGTKRGTTPPPIEVHTSIYARLSGEEGMRGEEEAHAQWTPKDKKIYLYTIKLTDEEQIIRSLIHEYTHYLQNPGWHKRYYTMGKKYEDHPYEMEALKREEDWEMFVE